MLEKILVTAAWPYIQHVLHLGNLIPILSADVIARYQRLKGNGVLFVCGSDEHGTPIELEAIRQRISPKELTNRNHILVSSLLKKWEISFDNYSRTESLVHKAFTRDFLLKVENNGYIFTQETNLLYCSTCLRFLPDRFVEGECNHCGYKKARGDQCEQCGRLSDSTNLKKPHCTICNQKPIIRKVNHWYFDLPKFKEKLTDFIKKNKQLPDNARNFSLSLLKEGLKPRSITRDNKWGIQAPFKEAIDKTLYVWIEAVLGYISATIEHSKKTEFPEKWRNYWFKKNAKTLFFIGKDNIPFHTLILPALLLATKEKYNLPWNVSTNEFLIFEGKKSSKSQKIGIWIDEALEMFPTDYWRYTLISIRPEVKDVNFTWKIFLEKVNSELNDNIGNFIHRTLTFINNNFNGEVPEPKNLNDFDKKNLNYIKKCTKKIVNLLENFKFQDSIREISVLSRIGNKYVTEKKPWIYKKNQPEITANTFYVAIQIVNALAFFLEPFIPGTAKKLRNLLNLPEKIKLKKFSLINVGHKIKKPVPLFHKIKYSEKELQKLLEKVRSKTKIPYEEFKKLDLRVGKIVKSEVISQSKKLLKLTIDIGEGVLKTALAGIADYYSNKNIEGRQVAIIANLEPRKIFGIESEVMILAGESEENLVILEPDKPIKTGSKIS
jgi:methionyl-tRNA synthetase